MSANNNCQFYGRMTRDPELFRDTDEKRTRVKFTIAVDRRNKAKADADFIDCVAFGKNAELISEYFAKGRGIIVNGPLQIDSYTDRDGVKRKSTQVIVDSWAFDGSRRADQAPTQPTPAEPIPDNFTAAEEDIPF